MVVEVKPEPTIGVDVRPATRTAGVRPVAAAPEVSLWDVAAVQVIVEEAGGRFTDLAGAARPDGGSAVSTNGLLHDEVLAALGPSLTS